MSTLSHYRLVTYAITCDCGQVRSYDELHFLTNRGNAMNDRLVKPGEEVYDFPNMEIKREARTSHTRACSECLPNLQLMPPPVRDRPGETIGLYQKEEAVKKKSIDVSKLEFD